MASASYWSTRIKKFSNGVLKWPEYFASGNVDPLIEVDWNVAAPLQQNLLALQSTANGSDSKILVDAICSQIGIGEKPLLRLVM